MYSGGRGVGPQRLARRRVRSRRGPPVEALRSARECGRQLLRSCSRRRRHCQHCRHCPPGPPPLHILQRLQVGEAQGVRAIVQTRTFHLSTVYRSKGRARSSWARRANRRVGLVPAGPIELIEEACAFQALAVVVPAGIGVIGC
eukprot:8746419-Pyramimonas_sp.AAC.3